MVSTDQFVLCTYDNHKWVGIVCEVDAHKDIVIKFMHPPCQIDPTLGQKVIISVGCP